MYLLNRGISTNMAILGGCGYAEKWEHWEKRGDVWKSLGSDKRVVFPIYDEAGDLIAIHGRAIDSYHIASSKITKGDKSKGLFLSDANVLRREKIAICEGSIDAMALQILGYNAVAMTGTTPPDWFYRKMIFKTVFIATDADEAGDKAAHKLKIELEKHCVKTERLRPQIGKDWGEFLEKSVLNE
jgi:DNA primase